MFNDVAVNTEIVLEENIDALDTVKKVMRDLRSPARIKELQYFCE